eukprot:GGOE01004433.1.p1 GENE.GGOE01004433.1~~GGOE01004433.1.p1  ORF type:complete len:111 (-),score=0.03 GGOE01004433.1:160-492(-)
MPHPVPPSLTAHTVSLSMNFLFFPVVSLSLSSHAVQSGWARCSFFAFTPKVCRPQSPLPFHLCHFLTSAVKIEIAVPLRPDSLSHAPVYRARIESHPASNPSNPFLPCAV